MSTGYPSKDPGDRVNGPGAWPTWMRGRHAELYRVRPELMAALAREQRRFNLLRGGEVAAEGIKWSDGSVALKWRSEWSPLIYYPTIAGLMATHVRGDGDDFVWVDHLGQP